MSQPRTNPAWRILGFYLLLTVMLVGCGRSESDSTTPAQVKPEADTTARYATEPAQVAPTIRPAAVLAPKPTGPLPPDAGCVTPACHVGFVTARQVHGPVSVGNCQSCHEPDAGGHTYPLSRPGVETCTFCHPVLGKARVEHKAITNNGCVSCHDPHASPTKFLLTGISLERTCAACHELKSGKHLHGPFAAGQCTLCHQPHEADNERLLRGGTGVAHCAGCHSHTQRLIANSPFVHQPAKENCQACHDPHSSDFAFQLRDAGPKLCLSCHEDLARVIRESPVSHDALFVSRGCVNCHEPHAAGREDLLRDRADKLCLQCHDKPATAGDGRKIPAMTDALSRKFLHGPVRAGDCAACHHVHGSSQARLLSETFPETFYASFDVSLYALCFTCHDPALVKEEKTEALTEFRDGDRNLHYVHVHREQKGRTCRTCHEIHGSDLPNHMAGAVPFEGSRWPLPIKFQKAPTGGSCAPGCHEPKTYDRNRGAP